MTADVVLVFHGDTRVDGDDYSDAAEQEEQGYFYGLLTERMETGYALLFFGYYSGYLFQLAWCALVPAAWELEVEFGDIV